MLIEQATQLVHNLNGYRITCVVTGEKWKQNSYIIKCISSSKIIVIDPGSNAEDIIQLIQTDGGKLIRILLTHAHHDHVGAAAQVSDHFNVVCELHKLDVRLLMHAPMYALSFANKSIPAIKKFQPFADQFVTTAEPYVGLLHTPGHTKGSSCFLFDGFVFTGDTLLYRYIGRTDLPGSNLQDLNTSVTALLAELPDDTIIFPGHGRPWIVKEAIEWWNTVAHTPPQHDQFIHV